MLWWTARLSQAYLYFSLVSGHQFISHPCQMRSTLNVKGVTAVLDRLCPCPHCPMSFLTAFELKAHVSSNHGHMLPYSCEECSKGYNTPSGLRMHKLTHKGVSYRCPVCLIKFVQKSSARRHMINLHGDNQSPVDEVFNNT